MDLLSPIVFAMAVITFVGLSRRRLHDPAGGTSAEEMVPGEACGPYSD